MHLLFGRAVGSGSGNKDKGFASMPHEHFVPLGCQHEPWEIALWFPFQPGGVDGMKCFNWCGITGKKWPNLIGKPKNPPKDMHKFAAV